MQNVVSESDKSELLNSDPDAELLLQFRRGDLQAFETLYRRHKDPVFRFILRQCRSQSVAEDLFQDTWKSVIEASGRYQSRAKFSTWLYTIAHNKIRDHGRHFSVVSKVMDFDADAQGQDNRSPEQQHKQARQADALKRCMAKLPMLQLETFLLKQEANMTASVIAEVIGASLEATKSRLRYAQQALRECLNKWQES